MLINPDASNNCISAKIHKTTPSAYMAMKLRDKRINTAKRIKIIPNTVDENKRLKNPHIATRMVSLSIHF